MTACEPLDGAEAMAGALRARMAQGRVMGTIRVYDRWFGGKPMDNLYTVVDARVIGTALVVDFDLRERLVVEHPLGGTMRVGHEAGIPIEGFVIAKAGAITWSQYAYTHPQTYTPDLFNETTYERVEGTVAAELLWYRPRGD